MNAMYEHISCSATVLLDWGNKSLIAAGNEECKSSYFVEVEVLIDGFPLLEK